MSASHPALSTSLRILGKVVSLPIIAAMLLLEPIVNVVFGFLMFGGILASIAFEISAVGSRFPFLVMLGISLG